MISNHEKADTKIICLMKHAIESEADHGKAAFVVKI